MEKKQKPKNTSQINKTYYKEIEKDFINSSIDNYNFNLKSSKTKFVKSSGTTVASNIFRNAFMAITILLFYIPIAIVMVFSFNADNSVYQWAGWGGTQWFYAMFQDNSFIDALLVSLIISITTTILAVCIGTLAAIGLHNNSRTWYARTIKTITNYPVFIADVVIGASLFVTFLALGVKFGIVTLIIANTMVAVPFVILAVLPRLQQIDKSVIDASFDLGAKSSTTLFKVIIPLLVPSIIAGAATSFSLTFDDFVLCYFIGGDTQNVSVWIYNMKKLSPIINAFSVLLILVVATFFIIKTSIDAVNDRRINWKRYAVNKKIKYIEHALVNELYAVYQDIDYQIRKEGIEADKVLVTSPIYNKSNKELIDQFKLYIGIRFAIENDYERHTADIERRYEEGVIEKLAYNNAYEQVNKMYDAAMKLLNEIKVNKSYIKGIVKTNLAIKEKVNELFDKTSSEHVKTA